MTKLLICHGLPGSGKSTWAEKVAEGDSHGRAARINRDDIRTVLAGDEYHSRGPNKKVEKQVTALRDQLISECLTSGKFDTVISDDTNLNRNTVRELYTLADKNGAEVSHQYFDVPVEECKRRNRARGESGGRLVPDNVIDSMAGAGYDPDVVADDGTLIERGHIKEFIRGNNGMVHAVSRVTSGSMAVDEFNERAALISPMQGKSVVILDADGTLFNNHSDAVKYLSGRKKNFPGFYNAVTKAPVNSNVLNMVTQMRQKDGLNIVLVTGRTNDFANPLIDALVRSGAPVSKLFMKREGDMRPSNEHKEDVINSLRDSGFVVVHAIDDRAKDVDIFRRNNVMVSIVGQPENDDDEPGINTIYGSGHCIRCGQPLKHGNIGPKCRNMV